MKGIINSELRTSDLRADQLEDALHESDYLVALMQRNFFEQFRYDPEDDRFANVTPDEYRAFMKERLERLAGGVWEVLDEVVADTRAKFSIDP